MSNQFKLAGIAIAATMAALPWAAHATPVDPSSTFITLNAGGGASYTLVTTSSSSGALTTGDGSVNGGSGGVDAYDDGNVLSVGGAFYAPTTADHTGQTYTGGVVNLSGLDTSLQYHADATSPLLRSLAGFTNATGSAISTTITWQHNLGADGSTQVNNSSSGNTSFGTDDSWVVTSDGGPGDPVTSFRWYGAGSPLETLATTAMTTTFSAFGNEGPRGTFDLTVGAGETVSLLFFSGLTDRTLGLSGAVSAASSLMAGLDSLAFGDALLTGLTEQQLATVANWDFDVSAVPEPGTLAVVAGGLFWLASRRRTFR